jgi:hypothetical protein
MTLKSPRLTGGIDERIDKAWEANIAADFPAEDVLRKDLVYAKPWRRIEP